MSLKLSVGSTPASPASAAPATSLAAAGVEEHGPAQSLATSLRACLPDLCQACLSDTLSLPLGVQLLLELVSSQLPPADWLPVLHGRLELRWMLEQAASRVHTYASEHSSTGASQVGVMKWGWMCVLRWGGCV